MQPLPKLTDTQQRLYDYLERFKGGHPLSIREYASYFGKSPSTIHGALSQLEHYGLIHWPYPRTRSAIEVVR
jgi:predicted transcriptional regulator